MRSPSRLRPALHAGVRRSPYFAFTEALGAEYMIYNHMYMPASYRREPGEDYKALTERVTLWDVGAERQVELRGPDALRLCDYLVTRDVSSMKVGQCRYALCCDETGQVLCDPVILRPEPDVVWMSHGNVDLLFWVKAIALHARYEVSVIEPDVAPMQVQGPRSRDLMRDLVGATIDDLAYYHCMPGQIAGVKVVISRTGWSGELGYEVFPIGSQRAGDVWASIERAGQGYGLLVIGPDVQRALEHGITDSNYYGSLGVNALEYGKPGLVQLEKRPFVGQEALRQIASSGPGRRVVGLLGPERRLPQIDAVWKVYDRLDGEREIGALRWATFSPALQRSIAIALINSSHAVPGTMVSVAHQEGAELMEVATLPFVESRARD